MLLMRFKPCLKEQIPRLVAPQVNRPINFRRVNLAGSYAIQSIKKRLPKKHNTYTLLHLQLSRRV